MLTENKQGDWESLADISSIIFRPNLFYLTKIFIPSDKKDVHIYISYERGNFPKVITKLCFLYLSAKNTYGQTNIGKNFLSMKMSRQS